MMNKIDVNGPNTHKVYQYLKTVTGIRKITWNFATYFLVSPDGEVQAYSGSEPYDLRDVIVDLMNEEL
jgi:glutathione peroxidase